MAFCEEMMLIEGAAPPPLSFPSNLGLLESLSQHPYVGFLFRCYSDPHLVSYNILLKYFVLFMIKSRGWTQSGIEPMNNQGRQSPDRANFLSRAAMSFVFVLYGTAEIRWPQANATA